MDTRQWFDRVTDGDQHGAVSTRIGVSVATVGRWLRVGRIPADIVIILAREYKADPVEGLLRCGYLTPTDFSEGGLENAIRHAPSTLLTAEIHRRATEAQQRRLEGRQ